jgi:hypothetical protein
MKTVIQEFLYEAAYCLQEAAAAATQNDRDAWLKLRISAWVISP